jgi:hypothetical protein
MGISERYSSNLFSKGFLVRNFPARALAKICMVKRFGVNRHCVLKTTSQVAATVALRFLKFFCIV